MRELFLGRLMNQKICRDLFDYQDGALYWRFDRGSNAKAGARAGRLLKTGYRSIHVSGRRYQEHRLIFLWCHGVIPEQIDHINQNKSDNRIENLRRCTHSTNQVNTAARKSKSGIRGVRFVDKTGRWAARIYKDGKEIRVGTFPTMEEASAAYREKMRELFQDFAS
jgi:hypothetical protein